ncbi:thiamine ABC transporter ATP-binding protein [Photobacterium leiognathi]|uniref:Thiamine ABC transporter ATP-binding protein n=1 Tax=Photobacterium leiognathi subsp. mandapamensis TaxID=48408 RepID=A0A2T3KT60_PHOLD|nr:thiamine ABC transporter ATP-binding protein [Photobacterium leiognathi]PSV09728.1 thiamine ABC transporter ATP-binding protein [Photobacterium leiognathi subsp. mandapamensis]
MLNINQLNYTYLPQHKNEVAMALSFDVQLGQGDIAALIGPSGAGKSTLLALIAGFLVPDSGDITINDASICQLEPAQRPLSMLFQEHNLFPHLSVFENIALGINPKLKLTTEQKQRVIDSAKQVGIDSYLERLPEQLSGGQRQRVALARCLLRDRPLLLLDEPFSALDPALRAEMLTLVKQLAKEKNITVLMITHSPDDARKIADKCIFIDDGKIKTAGITKTILDNPSIPELKKYLGLTPTVI